VQPAGRKHNDVAWDGHALIYENNELLAEANRLPKKSR
jgi:hypothetical protein